MSSEPSLDQQVRDRAGNRCEYCRMHQSLQGATFHVEHITPRSRGGQTALENLALNERAQFWDARRDLKHPGSFKDPGCCPTIRLGHLACSSCNLSKSDRVDATDSDKRQPTPLFHPRRNSWSDHFRFHQTAVEPLTATGRVTVRLLDLNHPRREQIREAESQFGLFPPAP